MDFLSVTVFLLRGKHCRSGMAGRVREFDEFKLRCSQTLTAPSPELAVRHLQTLLWFVARYTELYCAI
jgi:hypothetical protein